VNPKICGVENDISAILCLFDVALEQIVLPAAYNQFFKVK